MNVMAFRAVILLGMLLLAAGLSAQVTNAWALTLYDSGDPAPEEQLVLEYINRARANPTVEGARLGIDMWQGLCGPTDVGVRPPLAMNKILLQVAHNHSWDMYTHKYFDHNDISGHDPGQRMTNAGYNWQTWGENIGAGSSRYGATNLEDDLMIDSSTSCRLHRVNLFNDNFKEVGIGYYAGGTPNPSGLRNFLTQDFGSASIGPFLLGVVYNDADRDDFYDIGEGISGVQINSNLGSHYAVTSTSGGYALPIGTSGTITVTALGSDFSPITKTVPLTGTNTKLDFIKTSNSTAAKTTVKTSETPANSATFTTTETVAISTSATRSVKTQLTVMLSTTSSKSASASATSTTSSSITSTATEISEYQFSNAMLLIVFVGLCFVIRRRTQLA